MTSSRCIWRAGAGDYEEETKAKAAAEKDETAPATAPAEVEKDSDTEMAAKEEEGKEEDEEEEDLTPAAQPTPANYKTARLKSGANVHVYGKQLFRSFQHKAGVRIPCTCCGMNAFLSHTRALLSRLSPCFDVLGSGSRRC